MTPTTVETDYVLITDIKGIDDLVDDLKAYRQASGKSRMKLGFDTETYFSDEYYREQAAAMYGENKTIPQCIRTGPGDEDWEGLVRLFSLGLDPSYANKQYLIDVKRLGNGSNLAGRLIIIKYLKEIIEKDSILIGQNIQYDLGFLALQFNIYPEEVRDTMLIAQCRYTGDKLLYDNSEASFNLAALYSRCISEGIFISLTGMSPKDYESYKSKNQKSDWSGYLDDNQLQYAADDVRLIFWVYDSLIKECLEFCKNNPKSRLFDVIKIENNFALECALMGCIGVGFDSDYHKNELIPFLAKYAEDALEKLRVIPEMQVMVIGKERALKRNTWHEMEWCFADPARAGLLGRAIVENLGFTLPKTDSGKDYSVGGDILNEVFWEADWSRERDILELIIQCRTAKSYLAKNGESYLKFIHDDGRIHASVFQRGSDNGAIDTGRMSIQKPALQTIPNDPEEIFDGSGKKASDTFRRSFVAKKGLIDARPHRLVDGDFSNEEVRAIAKYSKDKVLIKAFQNNEDLHQKTADNLGVKRPDGKLFFLSTQYGAYPKKVMKNLYNESRGKFKASLAEVTELRTKHFQLYSGLAAHIEQCAMYVERQMEQHDTLVDFINRRPILIGISPTFKTHRMWCLHKDQEYKAWRIKKEGHLDTLHKEHKVLNTNTGKYSVFKNEYNKRKGEVIRELFNFYVQADCALVLKIAATQCGRAFRLKGWSPYDAQIIIPVHDEILADIREDLEEEATKIMHKCMYDALYLVLGEEVPTKISINSGLDWASAAPK